MLWHHAVATPAFHGLYAIVDVPHPHGLTPAEVTRAVLGDKPDGGRQGAAVVQLRAKDAQTKERVAWLRAMAPACQEAGVPLFINDDVDAAVQVEVDGLHLGQDDPGAQAVDQIRSRRPGLMIGLSTHDLPQLRDALRQNPDYVAFGPVATTQSKRNPDPVVGLGGLADAGRTTNRPLVAIGGLDASRGSETIRYGATMAAVISALVHPTVEQTRAAAIRVSASLQEAARPLGLDEVAALIPVLDRDLLADLAHWGDSLSVHLTLDLPARFAPKVVNGVVTYRYCEVLDLLRSLGKRRSETWDEWKDRSADEPEPDDSIVQLRRRSR